MKKRFRTAAVVVFALFAALIALFWAGDGALRANQAFYYGEDGLVPHAPAVTGTFIQPWLCALWTDAEWDAHLDMLLSAGIDTVILQWTAETPDGAFSYAGFPVPSDWKTANGFHSDPGLLEGLLKSAEKKGVKVFVGLNTSDEWWNNAFAKEDWRKAQANAGNSVAEALYGLYKGKYPHAFYGWYWPWEMYGNRSGYGKDWAGMMNANLDRLTALDSGMPLLFSPFVSSYTRLAPTEEEAMWKGFLADARLRPGDIFCPQDSVGAAGLALEEAGAHLAAMKNASGTKPGLLFWVNNENFTAGYKPATLDRFVSQLYVSAKYTDTHVCFSYSHYYAPDIVNASFDKAYKAYLTNGVDKAAPAPPIIEGTVSVDGRTAALTVTPADAADFHIITLYRGNAVIATDVEDGYVPASFQYRWEGKIGRGSFEYSATVTDCWGNVSDRGRVTVVN